jgi:hypothetical protein
MRRHAAQEDAVVRFCDAAFGFRFTLGVQVGQPAAHGLPRIGINASLEIHR